ncbi:oxidoreductase [Georgenia daeguensis]|uniref:Oxidoreductase n=1 Tax=Georgenia daeguensis TaxID=908355 RepID=A0ABP8EVH4_9MICO
MAHVALVTGGSSGIGRATALALHARGTTVYAAARGVDRMADLERRGINVLALDVTDDDSLRAAVGTVLAEQSRIDVLVNSAGYGAFGSIEETPLDVAREQFQVNLFGLARLTQLVLPTMRAQGSGRIVNISSLAGLFASPLGGWYSASKFALEAMSDSLRVEVVQFGIDVVLVEPGPVRTAWHARADVGLRHVSSSGPYAALARGVSKVITGFDDESITSDAEDVAAVVVTAATADRPRPRYLVGRGAHLAVAFRRILPDRAWDRAVLRRHATAG